MLHPQQQQGEGDQEVAAAELQEVRALDGAPVLPAVPRHSAGEVEEVEPGNLRLPARRECNTEEKF